MTKTGSPNPKMVELKTDPKQITFKVNKQSVLIWRRVLLLRYFLKLGENENVNVTWSDYDSKCKKITLKDERSSFKPIIPASNLAKSITQISLEGKKLVTITLYYTTFNCLVQGQVTQKWVETEFTLLQEKVQEMTKKGGGNVDDTINNIPLDAPQHEQVDNISECDQNDMKLTENTEEIENDQPNQPESDTCTLNQEKTSENNNNFPDIIEALHNIENEHIDNALALQNDVQSVQSVCNQILELLQNLNSKVDKVEHKVEQLCESKITERLDILEEKLKLNSQASHDNISWDSSNLESNDPKQPKVNETDKPDCVKFIGAIIELAANVSSLEQKFEDVKNAKVDYNYDETKVTNNDMEKSETVKQTETKECEDENVATCINVDTQNRFECLQKETEAIPETNTMNETESQLNTVNQHKIQHKDQEYTDLWIIGSSVTRNIKPKQMYKNKTAKVTTLQDKTVKGAKSYVKSGQVNGKLILLQIGSNDLNKKTPNEVLQEIEELIADCHQCMPQAKIILSEVLPRFQANLHWREMYEAKRVEYNSGLKRLGSRHKCLIVKSPFMNEYDVIDGIHPTVESGVPKLVSAYKRITNPLLGIKDHTSESYRKVNRSYVPDSRKQQTYTNKFETHPKMRRFPNYKSQGEIDNRYSYIPQYQSHHNDNENQNNWNTENNYSTFDYKHGLGDNIHPNETYLNNSSDELSKGKLKWVLKSLLEELY